MKIYKQGAAKFGVSIDSTLSISALQVPIGFTKICEAFTTSYSLCSSIGFVCLKGKGFVVFIVVFAHIIDGKDDTLLQAFDCEITEFVFNSVYVT